MDAVVVSRLMERAAVEPRGRVATPADDRFAAGWSDVCAWLTRDSSVTVQNVAERAATVRQGAGSLPLEQAYAHGFTCAAELVMDLEGRRSQSSGIGMRSGGDVRRGVR